MEEHILRNGERRFEMKIELFILYLMLILLNLLCGIERNSVIVKYQKKQIGNRLFNRITNRAQFFSALLLVFMIVLVVLNKENPDYVNYKWMYESGMQVEPGWNYLEKLAISFGMQYDEFKSVVAIISFIILFYGLVMLDVNENIILAIYAFYPFAMDAIQLRNLLAMALVLYAYHFLVRNDKVGRWLFAGLVIIASTIQSVFPIYLVLLLINHKNPVSVRNKLIGILLVCSFIVLTVMKIAPGLVNDIGLLLFSARTDKVDYYVQNNVGYGFLSFGMMHAFFTLSMYYCKKNTEVLSEKEKTLTNSIFWSDLLLLCTLPLLTIHIEFYRIYRNMCLLNYVALPILMRRRKTMDWLKGFLCFVAAWILYIAMDYFNYAGRFEYVFMPFFR